MMGRVWGALFSSSTRALWREARRVPGYSLWDFVHGYVYGRWIYLYIGIGMGKHWLSRFLGATGGWVAKLLFPSSDREGRDPLAEEYHGKVLTLEGARQLVTVEQDVRLTDLEQVIPYTKARDIILQHPDRIVVIDCPCRVVRGNPCQPLDVCLIIGEPFASFVIEHHPRRSRWISSEEALEILTEEEERGHVHQAFFKEAMLGRFYAICNCCACCCGAIGAHRAGTPMLAPSGYLAHVDPALCLGCGLCVDFCQFGALEMDEGEAVMGVEIERCMGCGVCVSHCPSEALALVRDASKGEPLEMRALMAGLDGAR